MGSRVAARKTSSPASGSRSTGSVRAGRASRRGLGDHRGALDRRAVQLQRPALHRRRGAIPAAAVAAAAAARLGGGDVEQPGSVRARRVGMASCRSTPTGYRSRPTMSRPARERCVGAHAGFDLVASAWPGVPTSVRRRRARPGCSSRAASRKDGLTDSADVCSTARPHDQDRVHRRRQRGVHS